VSSSDETVCDLPGPYSTSSLDTASAGSIFSRVSTLPIFQVQENNRRRVALPWLEENRRGLVHVATHALLERARGRRGEEHDETLAARACAIRSESPDKHRPFVSDAIGYLKQLFVFGHLISTFSREEEGRLPA
jgi:hypothetical protein